MLKTTKVIRRCGKSAELDISRIRNVIEWACMSSEYSLELEASIRVALVDGVTTKQIQDNLILSALEKCTPSEPIWCYIAGRLHIWSVWKDIKVSRGFVYDASKFTEYLFSQIGTQYSELLSNYSKEEIEIAYSWINPELDKEFDYAGATLLTSRYLLKNELPQEAFLLCALLLALPEAQQTRMGYAKQFYSLISQRKISLATPILANLRIPNGSLSSCFILAVDDNLESIFSGITDTARISKNGGGVGVNISRVRATGSWVMGKANASGGVIPWIKLLNDTAIAVNQGGRRAGAVTVGLDIWHLDVPEFLEIQAENGDQRRKAYDIFPQLVIPDEFMNRVQSEEDWTLVDPYEVRTNLNIELAELWGSDFENAYHLIESNLDRKIFLYKRVKAKDLFKTIMRSQIETGLPYLAFKDTINAANPNSHEGYIPGVNLCVESYSNVLPGKLTHCCNLISLNLAQIKTDQDLEKCCGAAVRILDNTIEMTVPPTAEAKQHNDRYRTIGVGCMGLADWLAERALRYQDVKEISGLFEKFAYYCTAASAALAQDRGAYPAFDGSGWSQGLMVGNKSLAQLKQKGQLDWQSLQELIMKHGIRNSHITAIAPNTSSSLIQGCTASILPVFSRFFINKAGKGAVPIAPPFLEDKFWHYQENKHLDQRIVVKAVSAIQEWIDTGISMELLFNLNSGAYGADKTLSAKDIFETLLWAWLQGCKSIYYVRSVQKDSFDDGCSSCAN